MVMPQSRGPILATLVALAACDGSADIGFTHELPAGASLTDTIPFDALGPGRGSHPFDTLAPGTYQIRGRIPGGRWSQSQPVTILPRNP